MIFKLLTVILTILIIFWGLYYLVLKKSRNRTSLILGCLYLIFGIVGLVINIMMFI